MSVVSSVVCVWLVLQDREVMDKAIDVHDHVIRTQLGKYNGYEVTTEGDAFLLAFHEASDAIAWSLATQQVSTPSVSPVPAWYPHCHHNGQQPAWVAVSSCMALARFFGGAESLLAATMPAMLEQGAQLCGARSCSTSKADMVRS